MANILDYLDWRGDLSLSASPFNEVDNFILTQVVSLDFTGLISEDGPSLPIHEVMARYDALCAEKGCYLGLLAPKETVPLARRLSDTPRFQNMSLSHYVNHVDTEKTEQFSAVTFHLPDGSLYLSYRGTDDTIAGWKEDFLMAVEESVPAQRRALVYLERVAGAVTGPIRLGGHSKGGNLAVYAAMHASEAVKARIVNVFNNDGPGFPARVLKTAEYDSVRQRIVTILPQYSLVGTMLTQEENATIVRSNDAGPLAHDGFRWEVLGTQFVRCEELSRSSRAFDEALNEMLDSLDVEQRREFVEDLFDALSATGAVTLTDLTENHLTQLREVAKKLRSPEVNKFLSEVLSMTLREYFDSARRELKEELTASAKRLSWKK